MSMSGSSGKPPVDTSDNSVNLGHLDNLLSEIISTEKKFREHIRFFADVFHSFLTEKDSAKDLLPSDIQTQLFRFVDTYNRIANYKLPEELEDVSLNEEQMRKNRLRYVRQFFNSANFLNMSAPLKDASIEMMAFNNLLVKVKTVYPSFTQSIIEVMQRNFPQSCTSSTSTDSSGLESFTIWPLQRILKYPLLLDKLVKAVENSNGLTENYVEDKADGILEETKNNLATSIEVADALNEDKRRQDEKISLELQVMLLNVLKSLANLKEYTDKKILSGPVRGSRPSMLIDDMIKKVLAVPYNVDKSEAVKKARELEAGVDKLLKDILAERAQRKGMFASMPDMVARSQLKEGIESTLQYIKRCIKREGKDEKKYKLDYADFTPPKPEVVVKSSNAPLIKINPLGIFKKKQPVGFYPEKESNPDLTDKPVPITKNEVRLEESSGLSEKPSSEELLSISDESVVDSPAVEAEESNLLKKIDDAQKLKDSLVLLANNGSSNLLAQSESLREQREVAKKFKMAAVRSLVECLQRVHGYLHSDDRNKNITQKLNDLLGHNNKDDVSSEEILELQAQLFEYVGNKLKDYAEFFQSLESYEGTRFELEALAELQGNIEKAKDFSIDLGLMSAPDSRDEFDVMIVDLASAANALEEEVSRSSSPSETSSYGSIFGSTGSPVLFKTLSSESSPGSSLTFSSGRSSPDLASSPTSSPTDAEILGSLLVAVEKFNKETQSMVGMLKMWSLCKNSSNIAMLEKEFGIKELAAAPEPGPSLSPRR